MQSFFGNAPFVWIHYYYRRISDPPQQQLPQEVVEMDTIWTTMINKTIEHYRYNYKLHNRLSCFLASLAISWKAILSNPTAAMGI